MINSHKNGSMGSLRSENSSSKLETTSPTNSVSESNNIAASLEFDKNILNPSSLNFEGLKFDVDVDVEVPSPDSSIWESLFADQIDSGADFMISSPKRIDYMISSPKRTDFMISSPKRTDFMIYSPKRSLPAQQISSYNQNYNCVQAQAMQAQSLLPCNSNQNGGFNTTHKGKAQSPLHKVLNSPSSNHYMHPESLALPAMDGFIDDYHRDGYGIPTADLSIVGCPPESYPAMLDCLPLLNSSRFCGSVNEVATPGGSQITQESGVYQMGYFAAAPPSQKQQRQQQQQQQQQDNLDHGLMGTLSVEPEQDQDSGLQLVHLLLACAEAVAKEDYMSARRYLHHLNRVVTPLGDSMQRVAACFTDSLSARLTATLTTSPSSSNPKPFSPFPPNSLEILKIYQILYQACPYIKFAHFTANQAIFEAFEAEERVHVIDLDILQGYQWPAFMQALAARPGGAPFLRITGVGFPPECVRETGRCLTELAHSLHIPFEFHPVEERLEDLTPHMFHRRVGEALAVNSVNRLHSVHGNSLGNLLGMIRDQAPNIVTLVEKEASHNGPYFLGRFLEALHYYSAIFDSLDATFPADSAQRAKVEQYIFAPEIRNIVACEGAERIERHERLEKWRKLMEGKGFKGVPLSANAVTQSKILLGLYPCDGYTLTEDKGCLLLGWQDRAIIAASAWRC